MFLFVLSDCVLLWSLLPNGSHILTLSTNSCCEDNTNIMHSLPWLVLARVEEGSYPELKVITVGPHPLYSLEISIVCVRG